MHQMRAVTLTGYLEVAASVGLDGPRMMRQAGIAPEALSNPETRLPANAIIDLVERSAELSGCENFGLLMAETRSFADLGPLALLLERLPNVREIMRAASDFQRHMNDVLTPSVEDVGDACLIRLDFEPGFWSVQMFDHAVGAGYRILTAATDGVWKPDCAHLVHKAPADLAPWRRVVPVPVEFDASFNGFSTTAEKMLLPNPNADETMARNARHLLHLVHVESVDSTADRVRRSIALMLPSGRATIEQIAKQLGMSARSLQRRLDEEGEQFAELLGGVRRELATAYLAESAHPVTTVASLLGYASPSSFTRWYSAEFGMSPQAWRGANTGEQQGPPPTWRR
jgi:AraC-like DNA-binding protein